MNGSDAPGAWTLLRRIALCALVAGVCAGAVLTAAQQMWVAPLIVEAEMLEARAGGEAPQEPDALSLGRTVRRGLGNVLLGAGFGLMLASAMSLRARHGDHLGVPAGLLWGLAGYAAFALAPSLGLPPQLPGVPHADVGVRQAWWLATAFNTAFGLAVLAFARPRFKAVGLALLLVPHLFPPPLPPPSGTVMPPELPARFAAAVLVTSALFWAVLGSMAGWVNRRLHP